MKIDRDRQARLDAFRLARRQRQQLDVAADAVYFWLALLVGVVGVATLYSLGQAVRSWLGI